MPANDIERPNYYPGQYLGAEELTAAIEYGRQQGQRHALAAHTWGIATGLYLYEQPKAGSSTLADVYLAPGYAADGFGRPIVVPYTYKLSEDVFAQAVLGAIPSEGRWVPVWLRFCEESTDPPAPGFRGCGCQPQWLRTRESFLVVPGDPSIDLHDLILGGYKIQSPSSVNKLPLPYDESIPYQTFPDSGKAARWAVPVGFVRWSGKGFLLQQTGAQRKKTAEGRRLIGVVAESVFAAEGKVRIRDRFAKVDPAKDTSDLAAVEGSLRVEGDLTASSGATVAGQLGVGTTTPSVTMEVAQNNSGGYGPVLGLTNRGSGAGTTAAIRFGVDPSDINGGLPGTNSTDWPNAEVKAVNSGLSGNQTDLAFSVWAGQSLNELLRLQGSTGNVGIGTASPASLLHVAGDVGLEKISGGSARTLALGATMVWNDGTWLRLNQNLDFSKPIFGVHTPGVFASGSLNIGGANSWGDPGSGNVWITGQVGLGTATPTENLHIEAGCLFVNGESQGVIVDAQGRKRIGLMKYAGREAGIWRVANQKFEIGRVDSADLKTLGANPAVDLFVDGSGNVGVGKPSPAFKLDVAGQVQATNVWAFSDARLKTNIKPLTPVLDKLENIHGVFFEGSDIQKAMGLPVGRTEIGLIAQELEAVFPELVVAGGPEQYRAVDYGRMTAVLIEAVKELRAEVSAAKDGKSRQESDPGRLLILLEAFKELRTEIDSLKGRIQELEHKLANKRGSRKKPKPEQ